MLGSLPQDAAPPEEQINITSARRRASVTGNRYFHIAERNIWIFQDCPTLATTCDIMTCIYPPEFPSVDFGVWRLTRA